MIKNRFDVWLKNVKSKHIEELLLIKDNEKEVSDRFFKDLAFGTGGLRGKIGIGTNRMNEYTVAKVTFGLGQYILNNNEIKSVVVAYDSRNKSEEFARTTSEVLSYMGIDVFLFDKLVPTPVLSYAVRYLKAGMGVVVTASHNPKEYNGYKVYNKLGCQLTDGVALDVTKEIEKVQYFEKYVANVEKIHLIGDEIVDSFVHEIVSSSTGLKKDSIPCIVYSPLNGAGNIPVQKLFKSLGIVDYFVVPEQEYPDGNFTTCPYPNPEEREAFDCALKLAKVKDAELVIATDPDADRVGIAVKDGCEYRLLNGNETGVIIENYILEKLKENDKLTNNQYIVKTIVTTPLAEDIANKYGVQVKNVLTGFKYIGETIDRESSKEFVFGMEESYGYLVAKHVRDKDAVSAIMAIVEAYAYYKSKGLNFISALEHIYKEYGYYQSKLIYKVFEGPEGMLKMRSLMSDLRSSHIEQIGGYKLVNQIDYLAGIDGLPPSDVLLFNGEGFTFVVRPSGTEPKIKIYIMAKEKTLEEVLLKIENLSKQAYEMLG